MKKVIKILTILLMILCTITIIENTAFAATALDSLTALDGKTAGGADTSAETAVGAIISAARIIAVGVALIMLAVIAMKYMMAAPGDKAEIKKHAVVYVVGAVVLFGVSGILSIIGKFATIIT